LLFYVVALSLVVFWPQHVDKGAGSFLRAIMHFLPIVTPHRVEFGANILLFVPLGVLLAIMAPRRRHIIAPVGFLVSLSIESVQGVLLEGRTASVFDIVANTAGACLGLLLVEFTGSIRRGKS
jgi:glycopeptide antibiotics resistance protein